MSCIDQGNQLLIITNTMNILTILQPSNLNLFLHGIYSVDIDNRELRIISPIKLRFSAKTKFKTGNFIGGSWG